MSTLERAVRILLGNRFVVIGTADADGPWTAPAQYRVLTGGRLYVESDAGSRHGRAIAAAGIASGAVYDSRADPADADGVQLLFRAREVPSGADEVRQVLAARVPSLSVPVVPGDVEDEVAAVLAVPHKRLYELTIDGAWVFDRDAWRARGTDARLAVDIAALAAALDEAGG